MSDKIDKLMKLLGAKKSSDIRAYMKSDWHTINFSSDHLINQGGFTEEEAKYIQQAFMQESDKIESAAGIRVHRAHKTILVHTRGEISVNKVVRKSASPHARAGHIINKIMARAEELQGTGGGSSLLGQLRYVYVGRI